MYLKIYIYILLFCSNLLCYASDKRIAITIDDAPMSNSRMFRGIDRANKIVDSLQSRNINRIGIFAIGANAKKESLHLKIYDDAGYIIGNHTYSHYNCKKVSANSFIQNIKQAHEVLQSYNNFMLLFRYPYLNECSAEKHIQVDNYLNSMGYKNAYVTIVTLDYYLNKLLQQAIKENREIDYIKLKELYLNLIMDCVNSYYVQYKKLLGYSPPHALLLHENDINALYIGDLIDMLIQNEWIIISPEEVYNNENIMKDINKVHKKLINIDAVKPNYIKKLFNNSQIFK